MSDIVCISYDFLQADYDLSEEIQTAFGASGLGIILIRGVPGLIEKRSRLLRLAHELATLPDKSLIEDAESSYSFGWSHGKERLDDGRLDVFKGSFYANPCHDDPAAGDHELLQTHPAYLRRNLWPPDLPQLEPAFKDLGQLIVTVGEALIRHCDHFAERRHGITRGRLVDSIARSRNHKARLLYYYPPKSHSDSEGNQNWCGWHLDHGSITGLTSAMYFNEAGGEIQSPDPGAGLYIRDRAGAVVKAPIPVDCLAFQMGEALQICSGDILQATPHYVRSCSSLIQASRATFAVFIQPSFDQSLTSPCGMTSNVPGWSSGETFSEFSASSFKKYYDDSPRANDEQ